MDNYKKCNFWSFKKPWEVELEPAQFFAIHFHFQTMWTVKIWAKHLNHSCLKERCNFRSAIVPFPVREKKKISGYMTNQCNVRQKPSQIINVWYITVEWFNLVKTKEPETNIFYFSLTNFLKNVLFVNNLMIQNFLGTVKKCIRVWAIWQYRL